jgi:hypothetical protein
MLVISSFIHALSQNTFKPGYIIHNNNEIENGFIKSGNKKNNFSECHFKKEITSNSVSYNPNDLKGYRYNDGDYFVSMAIDAASSKKVFLEYAFDGIVDVYYYMDNSGDHFYISKNGAPLVELKNDTRRILAADSYHATESYGTNTPTLYEKKSNEYIGMLKIMFKDAPETLAKTDNTAFSINSLVKLSENYHHEVCPDQECVNYSKKPVNLKIGIGPVFGINNSNLSFTSNSTVMLFENYPQSRGKFIGASIDVADPFISNKLSLLFEPAICFYKYTGHISYVKLTTLKMPLMLKVTLASGNIKPYLAAGFEYAGILNYDSSSERYDNFTILSKRNHYGVTAGIGTDIKTQGRQAIILLLRYEYLVGQHHMVLWDNEAGNTNSCIKAVNWTFGYKF